MEYNLEQMEWDDQTHTLSLFPYHSRRAGQSNSNTQRVIQFKENNDFVVCWVQGCASKAFEQEEADFLDIAEHWYIIAAPCSTIDKSNRPCERLCKYLENTFTWLHHIPNGLIRIQSVGKSATAYRENRPRPSQQDHIQTIRYNGPALNSSYGILLVDDVITTGSTFNACRDILRRATRCEHIFGFFLGRTPLS